MWILGVAQGGPRHGRDRRQRRGRGGGGGCACRPPPCWFERLRGLRRHLDNRGGCGLHARRGDGGSLAPLRSDSGRGGRDSGRGFATIATALGCRKAGGLTAPVHLGVRRQVHILGGIFVFGFRGWQLGFLRGTRVGAVVGPGSRRPRRLRLDDLRPGRIHRSRGKRGSVLYLDGIHFGHHRIGLSGRDASFRGRGGWRHCVPRERSFFSEPLTPKIKS
mmetsp:Transcript_3495/g.5486  ORF Transcript_3495/g.5486 Transcript_3495/m.5486 type:complete len:219 (-) Transcript_3495:174-830(-)